MSIDTRLDANLENIKSQLNIPENSDIVLRRFTIGSRAAFAVLIDGLINANIVDLAVLKPLMGADDAANTSFASLADAIFNQLTPHSQVSVVNDFDQAVTAILNGNVCVFADGLDVAFSADVKGWAGRSVSTPETENVIRGSQEAFVESMRVNTSLVRKIIRQKQLMCELHKVGDKCVTNCSMLYISDIANDDIVAEVRRRLSGISVDYLLDSGILEQLIEDSTFLPAPQILSTERPDRVAAALTQGKVAIIVEGSPFALVMPTNFVDLMHTTEDKYLRFIYANLIRIVRIFAVMLSLLLPAVFIAIVNYHYDAIPTDLLFAIEASRENVPFSLLFELLMLEIFFELIREAGIRVPSPIGPTIGIIGALIIGQAAVEAALVSPLLIIVVALTGIASFALPTYSLAFSFRVLKIVYIVFAAAAGFLGIAFTLFLHLMILCNAQSFDVPFLAPFAPKMGSVADSIVAKPIWKREARAAFLKVKSPRQQPPVSRKWAQKQNSEREDF